MIYIIKAQETNLVKIGFTKFKDINKRIDNLSTGCPFIIDILLFIEGTLEDERLLHNRFKHLHYNKEWFKYEDELKNYVENSQHLHIKQTKKASIKNTYTEAQKKELTERYLNNERIEDIAKHLGIKESAAAKLRDKLGLKRKRISKRPEENTTSPEFIRRKALVAFYYKRLTIEQLKLVYDKYPPKTITLKYQALFNQIDKA